MDDNKALIHFIVACAARCGEKEQEKNPDADINPIYEGIALIVSGMLCAMTEQQLLNVADGMGLKMDMVQQYTKAGLAARSNDVPVNSKGGGGVS